MFGETVPIPAPEAHPADSIAHKDSATLAQPAAARITLDTMGTQSHAESHGDIAPQQPDLSYQVGDLIGGVFRVESILSGGMGIVYICRLLTRSITVNTAGESIPEADLHNERVQYEAVKSFYRKYKGHADSVNRFKREALLWISLPPHPNIVRARTFFNGGFLLVLEYIDGGNLRGKMQAGLLPESEVIRISLEICQGMCFLQEAAGIIHRDIKPENILLTRSGTAKITDFGLARVLEPATERQAMPSDPASVKPIGSVTQQGAIVGTLAYMSPEQYAGIHEMSVASDVYSFGVVLYEMLTGRIPFQARSYPEWREKHAKELPTPPSEMSNAPAALGKIAMKCLEKRPDHRFSNFVELREELESYSRESGRAFLVTVAPSITTLEARMSAVDWNRRGFAFSQLGEYERAYDCARRALEMAPTFSGLNCNVGESLQRLGRLDEALPYLEREVQLHPKLGLGYSLLSAAYYQAKRFAEALVAIRKAAELLPDHLAVWRDYALQAGRAQSISDYERAMAWLRISLNASHVTAPTLISEAISFCQAGDLKDGFEFHILSIKRFPGQAASWYNYGVSLHRFGKKDEALVCYTRAIERDKAFTLAWANRGLISAERGDLAAMNADWRSAVASDPTHDASKMLLFMIGMAADPQFMQYIQKLGSRTVRYFL